MGELTCSLIILQCRVTKMCEIIAIIEPPQEIVAVVETVMTAGSSLNENELLKIYEQGKEDYTNGKPTPTKENQPFVYQLDQDVAKLGFEIEKLKNKSVKAVRIVVPAMPEKYLAYDIKAVINLPPECQNAICIKSQNGEVGLIETGETMSVSPDLTISEFYLAPVYRLEAETIHAVFDQQQLNDIDAAQERAERERAERERAERESLLAYKYLAKWLTDNYLDGIRAKAVDRELEANGIKVYVNKNGLNALLDKPFVRNSTIPRAELDELIYADAKKAMLNEKARIDRGEVDLSMASDFNVIDYNYTNDIL